MCTFNCIHVLIPDTGSWAKYKEAGPDGEGPLVAGSIGCPVSANFRTNFEVGSFLINADADSPR